MKNIGEITGILIGGGSGISLITKVSKLGAGEIIFIVFFVLVFSIIGGAIGIVIQKSIEKEIKQWNGKKMSSKEQS